MDPGSEHLEKSQWQKIARYLAGESSRWEVREIERQMEADVEFRRFVESIRSIWEVTPRNTVEVDAEKAWKRFSSFALQPRPQERLRSQRLHFASSIQHTLRIAAILVILVGLPYVFFKFSDTSTPPTQDLAMREISTSSGQRVNIKFSDGTVARLNSSTTIRFPEKFSDGVREVFLQGEAFFDVTTVPLAARDSSAVGFSPFIVHAGDAVVHVLGTSFNVKAWPEDKSVEVTVSKGRVAVQSQAENARVILTRGEMSKIIAGMRPATPLQVDLSKSLAWIEGRLVFQNTPLREVLKTLERQYNLTCVVTDSQILSLPLTASFKDESVTEILKIVSLSLDIKYKKSDRTVRISPKDDKL